MLEYVLEDLPIEDEVPPADPGLAARGLEVLSQAGVHAVEAVLGQARASHLFVVHERDLERAVREMHATLFAPEGARVP